MLGIVAAFDTEIRDFLKWGNFEVAAMEDSLFFYESVSYPQVVVASGAIGKDQAQRATGELIETYKSNQIVSAGFAAGAIEGARTGNVYLCSRLVSVEGPAAYWNIVSYKELFLDGFGEVEVLNSGERAIKRGGCLSTPQIVASSSMKRWIGSYFSVSVIDMESYWVAETAASYGVPRSVVRAIFDPVEQDLPDFIITAAENGENRPVGRAIRHILSNPGDAPKMIRLANQSKLAARSLASYLSKVSAESK